MKTESEKMNNGNLYYANDKVIVDEKLKAKELLYDLNNLRPSLLKEKEELLNRLFSKIGNDCNIDLPFYCDYGKNIEIGNFFRANVGCIILDATKVVIGDHVYLAPNVHIYTNGHPLNASQRNSQLEFAHPVIIGNNVWIGGNSVIKPGVKIGDNSVIGAGSVVTRNIPANVVAAGNPCRVIRPIRNFIDNDEKDENEC
ncbi:MAG: sugar O-acetyltransferase [Bacteroidales bacterium]|nr:sugar O-acetyltransferase [Bacteroidales bacterium]